MIKNNKLLYVLLIVALCLFFAMYMYLPQASHNIVSESTLPQVDTQLDSVPEISLPLLLAEDVFDATTLVDNTLLPREPYLLNVWGSWCIACAREHDMLKKLQTEGVTLVGVNYKDDVDTANDFLTEYGNPFTFVFFDEMGELGTELGLKGAPESFVVDGEGAIHQHIVGEITEDIWNTRIQPCHEALVAHKDATTTRALCH